MPDKTINGIVTWLRNWFYDESEVDNLLNSKQNTLVSGTNIKTINNQSLLGQGNISIQGGGSDVVDLVYPIGSIYMSVNSTSPSTLFGGTWEKIKDTFLLASGDIYSNGATGGEATHTLTIDEMPSHTHKTNMRHYQGSASTTYYSSSWTNQKAVEIGIDNTGGDQPHNNMPPYLTVNVWKRTA